ncbi:CHAP domain-containing protein [Nocardioides ganghwensis]|uniref:CHAP domain-containing protein n=1 Tax=Nocardioides ganghwensis TaxID=252230 RepID=A0A4Q2SG84_9ACTN|nr:CHAP domain-containing protein [Nocardioides ganghwensis]MBD3946130.1 CHAP domain-containing protein [Nocardioides ganghwensis]RYC04073.1 CHAP domain-containing protein [Nocardioides ganghwensis]
MPALQRVVRRVGRATKLVAGVLALLALAMPTTVDRISLTTSTYLCSGYAGCQAAGYGNYGYRQASSTMYWRMYTGHNCTNYVAYRLVQSGMPNVRPWDGSGNASNWGVAMASITDQTPTVGSVAWYKPHVTPAGSNGHVAIVEQVISDTEIIVSEDYWGGDFHWRRVTKSGGGWPTGFIHFNDRVVAPTTAPAIVGSPAVGAPLEVAAGAWTPTPSSVTVRWLADGAAIPGATAPSYVPTPDVKGKALTAEVTAELSGYTAGRAVLATAPVAPGTFQPTAQPTIQGVAEVGQTLTLTASSWSPQPAKVTTQWYADGVALDGATGASLVLTRDHIDTRISARTIASATGYRKSRSTAVETGPVLAKPVAITSPSRVKGTPEVGSKLVARAGSVKPSDATATYAWLRDGKRIAKATNPTYTVRKGDVGRSLSVEITLSRRHFRSTTEAVAVPMVTTTPTLKVRPDATRKRVAVDVRVRAPGASRPDGAVTVSVGGRTVEVQLVRGRARAVVRGVRPGTKPVVVRYAGTEVVRPAVARTSVEVPQRAKR